MPDQWKPFDAVQVVIDHYANEQNVARTLAAIGPVFFQRTKPAPGKWLVCSWVVSQGWTVKPDVLAEKLDLCTSTVRKMLSQIRSHANEVALIGQRKHAA
jgi:hypothetical protein